MSRADATAESYPRLREVLGEDGFKELARLIRTTYEANEQLTRVAMPTYDMGRIAVEILLRLIGGEEAPPQDVILQAPLQLGTSCRAHGPEPERT